MGVVLHRLGLLAVLVAVASPAASAVPDPWSAVSQPPARATPVVGAVGPGAGYIVASPGVHSSRTLVSRPLSGGAWRVGTLSGGGRLILPEIDTIAGATRTATVYAAGQGTGLLRSLDGGRRWADAGAGRVGGQVATAPGGATVLATAPDQEPRALLSGDRGRTWRSSPFRVVSSWGSGAVAIRPDRPSTLVVSGSGPVAGTLAPAVRGILVSTDAGGSWALRSSDAVGAPVALAVTGGRRPVVVIATARGIFRSVDLGRRWSRVAQVPRARPAVSLSRLASTPGPDPRILYGDMNGVWIGCARGTSWRLAARRPAGMVPYDVAVSADGGRVVVSGRGGVTTAPLTAFPCA
ncbi:MAG: WD40/YVTN/BNR-like repeat-containing protein [Thermoleophilia bacterium]